MKILAIETSCDETGIALLEASGGLSAPKFQVVESLVSSQIKIHRPFGGVVPNLAKREHLKNLPILMKELTDAHPGLLTSIDLITVTIGPGLEPALWTGIEFAKQLAAKYKKPLIGANHLEGHLYSFLLPKAQKKKTAQSITKVFPAIALIVSGGHTTLLRVESLSKWKLLGETRDDAAGEAFDKVSRMLDLPYPGGPEVEKLALKFMQKNERGTIKFPRPMMHDKNYDFSFSGLKTAVLYYLRDNKNHIKGDVATSFQQATVEVLVAKTIRAARDFGAHSIILCGGVAANTYLRNEMKKTAKEIKIPLFVPEFTYNLDNAAMIGAAGYLAYRRKKIYKISAQGNLSI